jgi:dTDP-4-amino-4,6-dideoxygalactose transaminase
VSTPVVLEGTFHVYNQYTLRVPRRDELRSALADKGIGTGVYYPIPLHLQECFASLGGQEGQLPVAEQLCREVVSLPIFPELGEARLQQVGQAIRDFFGVEKGD